MQTLLKLSIIYVFGGTIGWITEFFFRRAVHKKWINPGFLVGPNLPLYGTGITLLYAIWFDRLFVYFVGGVAECIYHFRDHGSDDGDRIRDGFDFH